MINQNPQSMGWNDELINLLVFQVELCLVALGSLEFVVTLLPQFQVLGMQPKQMMLPFVLFVVALVFSPGCSGTPSIDQIGLEFRNLPTSASLMTGLKLYTTNPGTNDIFNFPLITKFLFQLGWNSTMGLSSWNLPPQWWDYGHKSPCTTMPG